MRKCHSASFLIAIARMRNPMQSELFTIQNIVQNEQGPIPSNPKMGTRLLARSERAFLKHGAERLGKIIAQRSSGPRVIAELSSPVDETLVLFVDRQSSQSIDAYTDNSSI
jgi:hypothetical protein